MNAYTIVLTAEEVNLLREHGFEIRSYSTDRAVLSTVNGASLKSQPRITVRLAKGEAGLVFEIDGYRGYYGRRRRLAEFRVSRADFPFASRQAALRRWLTVEAPAKIEEADGLTASREKAREDRENAWKARVAALAAATELPSLNGNKLAPVYVNEEGNLVMVVEVNGSPERVARVRAAIRALKDLT